MPASWEERRTTPNMRLAFAITALFPTGGLQRDALAVAKLLAAAGHEVTMITTDYRAEVDRGNVGLEVWRAHGLTRGGRARAFARALTAARSRFDRIVGFNKIPGVDIYYCADPPRDDVRRRRLGPFALPDGLRRVEGEVFGPASRTALIVLAEQQIADYRRVWETPRSRFRLLPPTLAPARRHPEQRVAMRDATRASLGLAPGTTAWLTVASAPRTKGLDRAIAALAADPGAVMLVAGIAPESRGGRWIMRAAGPEVARRIRLLGYREDMPAVMAAADLLVHPARRETTGTTILESLANGLPAIVSGLCGYAPHVRNADAGIVLPEPFLQADLHAALAGAADPALRRRWSENGIAYGADPGLSTGLAVAAELMVGPLWS